MTSHLQDVEILDQTKVGKLFNAGLPYNLGVYTFGEAAKFDFSKFENKLLDKLVSQIEEPLSSHIVVDDLDGISLLVTLINGGRDGGLLSIQKAGFLMSKEKSYYMNKHNDTTGETYYEYRQKTARGEI